MYLPHHSILRYPEITYLVQDDEKKDGSSSHDMARDTILARNMWKGSAVAGWLVVRYPYYN
jgi:hypothetical protein